MNKLSKESFSLLKLNLELVYLFVEASKPFLKEADYEFYKQIIQKIDLKRNVYNILHELVFIVKEINKYCSL